MEEIYFFPRKTAGISCYFKAVSLPLSINMCHTSQLPLFWGMSESQRVKTTFSPLRLFIFTNVSPHNLPKRLPLAERWRGALDGSSPSTSCSEECLLFVKLCEWWKWRWRHLPWTTADRVGVREGGREAHCLMGETHNEATNLQRLSLMVTGQEVPCY